MRGWQEGMGWCKAWASGGPEGGPGTLSRVPPEPRWGLEAVLRGMGPMVPSPPASPRRQLDRARGPHFPDPWWHMAGGGRCGFLGQTLPPPRSPDMPRARRRPRRGCWRGLTRSTPTPGPCLTKTAALLCSRAAHLERASLAKLRSSCGPARLQPWCSLSLRSPVIRAGGGGQSPSWGGREGTMYIAWCP